MPTPLVDRAVRHVLPLLILAGTLVAVVRLAASPLTNHDTYFHLRFGHEFLAGSWSLRDPGTVTPAASAEWVPTQWLAQLVMAQMEAWFGLDGVAWLSGLQLVALVVVLYWSGRRSAAPVVVGPLVVLALVACAPGLSMRPQVLSYILFAVTVRLLLDARVTGRPAWALVPLVGVWACLHGMWPAAIVLAGCSALGLAFERATPRRDLLLHASVPVLAAAAACVTPVGPRIYAGVAQVVTRRDYFSEWGPPDFTAASPAAAALLLVVAVAFIPSRPGQRHDALLLLALAGLTVFSSRTVPLAGVGLLPLAACGLQRFVPEAPRVSGRERATVSGLAAASLAVLAAVVPGTASPPAPEAITRDLDALPAGTVVLNDWSWGGYLMWRHPQLDIVMHGYGDAFTDDEIARNRDILDLAPGWDLAVAEIDPGYALVDPESPLGYALLREPGWSTVEEADDVVLLRATAQGD